MASGGLQKDTDTLVAALSNKYVDMISHPDHPAYQLDYQTLAKEAARMGKILEINSQSLEYRQGTMENADLMVKWCKRYDTRVAVSSDAHSAYGIGRFGVALRLLEDNGFPEELVINVSQARFEKYIEERAGRIGA
jgi:putative hydrolase